MNLNILNSIITKDNKARKAFIEKLIYNERNNKLREIRKYYDGKHWKIAEDGTTNETTSNKKIWGKSKISVSDPQDPYQRTAGSKREPSFSYGQLQTKNYIKRFIQTYQDFIVSGDKTDISITYQEEIQEENSLEEKEINNENIELINESLKYLWKDIDIFFKEQVSRMVLNTVGVAKLSYDNEKKDYYIDSLDAINIFPIYTENQVKGIICAYEIPAFEASLYDGVEIEKNVATVPYAKIYYYDENIDRWMYVEIVNGYITNPENKPEVLIDEMNFNPFSIVANLDHPFRRFDINSLEDSEVFDWIDKNDTLNAQSTIEYLTNLFLASPKVSLDLVKLKDMNIDPNGPEILAALQAFQYSPFTIDTLPIEVHQGNGIPESFYTGLDITKQGLFEDASIPAFLANGSIPSGVAVETIELGMMMMTKKIDQKRQQIVKLIRDLSSKYLKLKGFIEEIEEENIIVQLPPVTGIPIKEMIETIKGLTQNQIVPVKYAKEEILKLLSRSEDIERIKDMEAQDTNMLLKGIESQRSIIRSENEAMTAIETRRQEQQELSNIQSRIDSLNA